MCYNKNIKGEVKVFFVDFFSFFCRLDAVVDLSHTLPFLTLLYILCALSAVFLIIGVFAVCLLWQRHKKGQRK